MKYTNIINVGLIERNHWPEYGDQVSSKLYVDNTIRNNVHESTSLRLHLHEKVKLDEQDSIVLTSTLTSPKTIIEIPTKSYVDSLHESSRKRRELSSVFNDQDNEFDNNKLTNLDSITVIRNPTSDNEVANKKYIEYSIQDATIVRFNQTLTNYLKVSVGNDTYNLTKYDEIQITDTTDIKFLNIGGDLLQK